MLPGELLPPLLLWGWGQVCDWKSDRAERENDGMGTERKRMVGWKETVRIEVARGRGYERSRGRGEETQV